MNQDGSNVFIQYDNLRRNSMIEFLNKYLELQIIRQFLDEKFLNFRRFQLNFNFLTLKTFYIKHAPIKFQLAMLALSPCSLNAIPKIQFAWQFVEGNWIFMLLKASFN